MALSSAHIWRAPKRKLSDLSPCALKVFSLVLSICVQKKVPSLCCCLNLFQCLSLNLVQLVLICVGRRECDRCSYSSSSANPSSSAKLCSSASASSSSSSWSSRPVRTSRLRLVELLEH